MIIGIGNDLVYIDRIADSIQQFGNRFIQRCFTEDEIKLAESRRVGETHVNTYAKRFAAKEAVAKALGTGFRGGLSMQHIEVLRDEKGRPNVILSHRADELLKTLTPKGKEAHIHLSLSDEKDLAQAIVMIEAV